MEIMPLLPVDEESIGAAKRTSVAGIYDILIDGSNGSAAEQKAAAEVQTGMPGVNIAVKENISFTRRCVKYMLQRGVTQFVDIGSGFLTTNSIHALDSAMKVVYVDKDPSVVEKGIELLGTIETATIICADIRQPKDVLENLGLTRLIDFSQPVGILMMYVACFLKDPEIASVMSSITSTICDDSFVAMTHDTLDGHNGTDEKEKAAKALEVYANTSTPLYFRNHKEVEEIFGGLQIVDPGVVFPHEWHTELDPKAPEATKWLYCGLAKKSPSPLPARNPQIYANPMKLLTAFNQAALSGTSVFVILWYFITFLVQSFMEVTNVSLPEPAASDD